MPFTIADVAKISADVVAMVGSVALVSGAISLSNVIVMVSELVLLWQHGVTSAVATASFETVPWCMPQAGCPWLRATTHELRQQQAARRGHV